MNVCSPIFGNTLDGWVITQRTELWVNTWSANKINDIVLLSKTSVNTRALVQLNEMQLSIKLLIVTVLFQE